MHHDDRDLNIATNSNSKMLDNANSQNTYVHVYDNENIKNDKQTKIRQILDIVMKCNTRLNLELSYNSVAAIIEEAYDAEELEFGKKEAIEWGADFYWPSDIVTRDLLTCRRY